MRIFFGGILGTVDATLERAELQNDGSVILFTRSKYGQKTIRLTGQEAMAIAHATAAQPQTQS